MRDYYEILQLPRTCSETDVKKAYRSLALKYHPDKNSGKDTGEKFKLVAEAYQVLVDPQSRRDYDYKLNNPRRGRYRSEEDFFDFSSSHRHQFVNPHDIFRHFFRNGDPFESFFNNDPFFSSPFQNNRHSNSLFSNDSFFSETGFGRSGNRHPSIETSVFSSSFGFGDGFNSSVKSRSQQTVIRNGRRETITTTTENGQTTVERQWDGPDNTIHWEKSVNGEVIESGKQGKKIRNNSSNSRRLT